jgi:hypothetical protein
MQPIVFGKRKPSLLPALAQAFSAKSFDDHGGDRREPRSWAPRFGGHQVSASEHLYFAVRSLGSDGAHHILQYAFVDDRGTVVLSACARSTSPVAMLAPPLPEDLAVQPLDPEAFEYLMTRLCGGATLVAYHRVLQGGLLPYEAVASAASVECAWRRFQQVARRRGIRLSRGEPLALNDCLEKAGLPVPDSEDAAMRALSIRALWRWMEG